MFKTTNAYITLNGVTFTPGFREEFLSDFTQSENLLDESLGNVSVYGRDLMMFATGDLFQDEKEFFESGDLKDLGGLLNYAQAITHRLMTSRGTHPEDSFFGVPWNSYIGAPYASSTAVISRLVADITEELYKDRRTSEVISVNVVFDGPNTLSVACSVAPVLSTRSPVEINLSLEGNQ